MRENKRVLIQELLGLFAEVVGKLSDERSEGKDYKYSLSPVFWQRFASIPIAARSSAVIVSTSFPFFIGFFSSRYWRLFSFARFLIHPHG
jgi:hypothetical protein